MQNPELFACLSKERKENLLGTLLFRPSIYERLYYEEEIVRKQIVCYEEFLQIVRNPQIRAAAPEIDFEFEWGILFIVVKEIYADSDHRN